MGESSKKTLNVFFGNGDYNVNENTVKFIEKLFGINWNNKVWDGNVNIPYAGIDDELQKILLSCIDNKNISFDPLDRLKHSIGKSSVEILNSRLSILPEIVDAVVYPDYNELQDLLKTLKNENIHITVYGGGTSVTGGLISKYSGTGKTIAIDTYGFKKVGLKDGIAICGSGLTGKELEEMLNTKGKTMGNFPESFNYSTVGGWIATKESGQESNQYGDIENMVSYVELARSDGLFSDPHAPRFSSGISVKDVALGSEGKCGIIMNAGIKIYNLPERRYHYSYFFKSFKGGIKSLMEMEKFPTVLRLSDETETEFLFLSQNNSMLKNVFDKYLSLRNVKRGSLLILINNDEKFKKPVNGIYSGRTIARIWENTRYERPYFGNVLWKHGLVPDTLETGVSWENIIKLYDETISTFNNSIRTMNIQGVIMSHISHFYIDGCAIYFTFIIKTDKTDDLIKIRENMINTFIRSGGSVTHHHGLGKYFEGFAGNNAVFVNRLGDDIFDK